MAIDSHSPLSGAIPQIEDSPNRHGWGTRQASRRFFLFRPHDSPLNVGMSRDYILQPFHAEVRLQLDYARELN
ncbi:MAG TPA: hypothetical protein VI136_14460, partial [Verrucomicrobiae bacterium]